MKRLLVLLLLVVLVGVSLSCSTSQREPAARKHRLMDSIQGIWWRDTTDPSAAFWIEKDTIINVEHFTRSPFKLEGNRMTTYYDEFAWTNTVAMSGLDTMLVLSNELSDTAVFFRWTNEGEIPRPDLR